MSNKIPKYRAYTTIGMQDVIAIDFLDKTVTLDDGDKRSFNDIVLMRYVNYEDKNGVPIYEGDVVKHDQNNPKYNNPYKVEWNENKNGWNVRLKNSEYLEVIGNFLDNHELLDD